MRTLLKRKVSVAVYKEKEKRQNSCSETVITNNLRLFKSKMLSV